MIRASHQNPPSHTMKYSLVKFRKDNDGVVIAFEICGCEADANTFLPCPVHKDDKEQAARLKAEAYYHSIQNRSKEDQ